MFISKKKFEQEVNRRIEKITMERNAYEHMERIESNLCREMRERDERWARRFEDLQKRMNEIDRKDDQRKCPLEVKELASY